MNVVFEKYGANVAKSNYSTAEKSSGVVGLPVIAKYATVKISHGLVSVALYVNKSNDFA